MYTIQQKDAPAVQKNVNARAIGANVRGVAAVYVVAAVRKIVHFVDAEMAICCAARYATIMVRAALAATRIHGAAALAVRGVSDACVCQPVHARRHVWIACAMRILLTMVVVAAVVVVTHMDLTKIVLALQKMRQKIVP